MARRFSQREMSTFDLVVLGCGGGPSEHNLSSYLLKPSQSSWSDGIISIEAGSGLGALSRILESTPDLFGKHEHVDGNNIKSYTAVDVLSWLRCYLITHAHMDHINGLVLCAGSLAGGPKSIYAVNQTLKDIEVVFSDRLWPNLASWDEDKAAMLHYKELRIDGQYTQISDSLSVRAMPLSHGRTAQSKEVYESTAFFVRHDASRKELLFFGDLEPDCLSKSHRNRDVWCIAAEMIPQTLFTIFIECSYPSGRPEDRMYGHMSPEYLVSELTILAEEVVKARRTRKGGGQPARKKPKLDVDSADDHRNALTGLTVYVIHCKEDFIQQWDRPIHQIITEQVTELVEAQQLGAKIVAAEQGMSIRI